MNITATAQRWEHGWEISINNEPVTQISTLDKASEQVRDYLDTIEPDVDHTDWVITVVPDLGALGQRVLEARAATAAATVAQEEAARLSREVAKQLREELSVTDTAAVLGVSRGRVSQLAS